MFVFGIVAALVGCILGTALSGMMTAFVMRTIGGSGAFRFGFYPDTVILTLLFFAIAFLFVGAWNIRRIYKIKLIDLLNEKKANEGQRKKKGSYLVSLVIALVCFAIDGVVLYDFSHINGIYAGNIPEEISNRYQAAAIVVAIAGIFALYNARVFKRGGTGCWATVCWSARGIGKKGRGKVFELTVNIILSDM